MMSCTEANLLLLSACLAHDDASRAAFDRWQREYDIDDIDGGGFVLLPLLESRLAQLSIEHPWRGRMQGVVRKARVEQTLDHAAARAAQRTLHEAGVNASLLGVSFEVPPLLMNATIYVAFRDASITCAALTAAGWVAEPSPRTLLQSLLPVRCRSGITLRSRSNRRLSLRWLLLDAQPSPTVDAEMLARASHTHHALHFTPADAFLRAALLRPASPQGIALACLARRHCDDAALIELHHTAAALDAQNVVAEMLHFCADVAAGRPLTTCSHSPFTRMYEAARRRLACIKLLIKS